MSSSIFNLFARSPIRPLQKHIDKAQSCAELLIPFLEAVLAQDWDKANEIQTQISQNERDADDLKKDLRLHLPKGLFMPVPRADLLSLVKTQDRIANQAKDIAGIILGRRMVIPDAIKETFRAFVSGSIDATRQAKTCISELDELYETGFSGREIDIVEAMIDKLDEIERNTDDIQIEIRQQLFEIEEDLPPITVMFLYRVIQDIGELADRAQQVGSRLQLLLAQ